MEFEASLRTHPLFEGIHEKDIKKLLGCLHSNLKTFQKNEYILIEGTPIDFIAIVLSGRVLMEQEDREGNSSIFAEITTDHTLGDTFISVNIQNSNVCYKAATNSRLLLIHYENFFRFCSNACGCHKTLLYNLISCIAGKNRQLANKLEILSKKTLRDKIVTYLTILQRQQSQTTIHSPLNRVEMADYLCVNRSAMTRELTIMRREGLLEYDRNTFTLYLPKTEM